VKIALQLIDNILFDRYDLQIVRSILLLAESIGVDCIAEGCRDKGTVRPSSWSGLQADAGILSRPAGTGR